MKNLMLILVLSLYSCSSFYIKKTQNKTEKMKEDLFEKNDNVFTINLDSQITFVWSYSRDTLNYFKIYNGRVVIDEKFNSNTKIQNVDISNFIRELEYCMTMGVERLEFYLRNENFEVREYLPIDMECFFETNFDNALLNSLKIDIQKYDLYPVISVSYTHLTLPTILLV